MTMNTKAAVPVKCDCPRCGSDQRKVEISCVHCDYQFTESALAKEARDGEQQTHDMVVRNLAMLVRRLAHRITSKYKAPDDAVVKQAWDYLMGEGLQGSILREAAARDAAKESDCNCAEEYVHLKKHKVKVTT